MWTHFRSRRHFPWRGKKHTMLKLGSKTSVFIVLSALFLWYVHHLSCLSFVDCMHSHPVLPFCFSSIWKAVQCKYYSSLILPFQTIFATRPFAIKKTNEPTNQKKPTRRDPCKIFRFVEVRLPGSHLLAQKKFCLSSCFF